jgi:ribonuclease HI
MTNPPYWPGFGKEDQIDLDALAEKLDSLPSTVVPQEVEVLERLPSVRRTKRQARRLAKRLEKPLFINTDASCRYGLAGLAYESRSLGNRIAFVMCERSVEAEYLAMLMAMEDTERVLSAAIVFRTDSSTVANLDTGDTPKIAEYSERVSTLLKRHPNWWIVRVKRISNRPADKLASRPFNEMGQRGREFMKARYRERHDTREQRHHS